MFLRYLSFCPVFCRHVRKRRDQKPKVKFKIHDVTGYQVITIHILHNISRSKDNQTMKLGQLIEYNIKIIFLYTKSGEKLVPSHFIKNQNRIYLWINSLECSTACFCFTSSGDLSKYIKTKANIDKANIYIETKIDRGLDLISMHHFLYDFWR